MRSLGRDRSRSLGRWRSLVGPRWLLLSTFQPAIGEKTPAGQTVDQLLAEAELFARITRAAALANRSATRNVAELEKRIAISNLVTPVK
jgi:hypothetical protein